MPRFWSALVLGFAVACGGDSGSSTAPSKGYLAFKIDAATCAGLGTVATEFFIDGSSVGTATLSPGQQSSAFPVDPGPHVTLVKVSNTGFGWTNSTMTVTAGQTLVRILPCG